MGKVQMSKLKRNEKGITLIALVITIIVLIILAGIAISMTVGENGIFAKAKEAKRVQITAEAKEKIGADILDAQIEATQKNETLQQSKIEEIISKYGELQADGDTIKLKDNGYEISLKEIYNGTTSSSGGSTGGSTGSAELDSLKAELAQTTATEDKILKDYKAYSNGKLLTGTMENYSGQTVTASTITENGENAEITIPQAGYYGTDSKVSIPVETIKNNVVETNKYKGYIFKDGTFIDNSFVTNGFYGTSGSATINNKYLEVKGTGNGGTGRRQYVILQTAIDLTSINKIYCELEESRLIGNFRILLSTSKPTSYSSDPTSQASRYAGYNSEPVDVIYCTNTSKLSGTYYMTIYMDGSSVVSDYFDAFIKTIAYE